MDAKLANVLLIGSWWEELLLYLCVDDRHLTYRMYSFPSVLLRDGPPKLLGKEKADEAVNQGLTPS